MAITGIGDNDDRESVLKDAQNFYAEYFPQPAVPDDPASERDANELDAQGLRDSFADRKPPYWVYGEKIAALIQVHDLVEPLDAELAATCLRRLSYLVQALLDRRDDKWDDWKFDGSRGVQMHAWGQIENNRDGRWNTDVDTSGRFTFPMAAFARRVTRNARYHQEFGAQAIQMIVAVFETYQSFRRELHLEPDDPHAYFRQPVGYGTLKCNFHSDDEDRTCANFKRVANQPLPYNQTFSMLKTLTELTLAADSPLFRASPEATADRLSVMTRELPLVIARGVAFLADHMSHEMLDDGSPWFRWDYELPTPRVENTQHGGFTLGCLAVILEARLELDQLLARSGRSERIRDPSAFAPTANTFLRKLWRNNALSYDLDGDRDESNKEVTGWIMCAQFDPWVWKRAREAVFHPPSTLWWGNHAGLLYYRRFSKMKFLTQFGGQNWLITPAATAVGEPAPANIHEQKWLLVLSGVVIADQRGDNSGNWNRQTVAFTPDMAGPDAPGATSGPLNWAIQRWRIPRPPGAQGSQYLIRFSVEEWSPFVSPNATLNLGRAIDGGFAVDTWRPNSFGTATNVLTHQPVGNLFSGVNADLAVRDNDAWLLRLGYHITLIGKIVFVNVPLG